MAIILVAVVDVGNGIGDEDGNLLFKLPKDMQRFKQLTTNKHVVMGRKTWDSLPVKPLPKRKNYVLTSDDSFEVKGRTKILNSIEEIIEMGKRGDVYVIGGGEVYTQMIPYADKLYLTHVHRVDYNARVFFPEISPRDWKLVKAEKHEKDKKNEHPFTFAEYIRQPAKGK